MDNSPVLWTGKSSAHAVHREGRVLPSGVPSFTQVLHSPIRRVDVMQFTLVGDEGCCVAEQWTTVWKGCAQQGLPCGQAVDNRTVARGPGCSSTVCGDRIATSPQALDLPVPPSHGAGCGQDLDNFPLPRVWTVHLPIRCGEPPCGGTYSNSAGTRGARPPGRACGVRTSPGKPEPARRRAGRGNGDAHGRGQEGRGRPGKGAPRAAGRAPRPGDPGGPGRSRHGPGNAEGAPRSRTPGGALSYRRGGRAVRQLFLMRLVSSVTWL